MAVQCISDTRKKYDARTFPEHTYGVPLDGNRSADALRR